MTITKWREGRELAEEIGGNLKDLTAWIEEAGAVVNAAADLLTATEPMRHQDYQADGYWISAEEFRTLRSAVESLR